MNQRNGNWDEVSNMDEKEKQSGRVTELHNKLIFQLLLWRCMVVTWWNVMYIINGMGGRMCFSMLEKNSDH